MNISQVYAVYFSATGNTRKVTTTLANALAVSFEVPLEVRDFTLPAAREERYEFAEGDLVIFGMPTYAGKLPNKLLDFVKSGFAGNGALAVPVVTFGNRSFDNSLAELCACLEADGFHTIGAGAFACRHAFTDALAAGRPDSDDMAELAKQHKKGRFDIPDLTMFENIAYTMALQANAQIGEISDWLDEFKVFDIYEVLPELFELWGANLETTVTSKKNKLKVIAR